MDKWIKYTLSEEHSGTQKKQCSFEGCTSEESVPGNGLGEKMIVFMKDNMKTIVAISEWALIPVWP
jgi:hypothetical protein